MKHEVRKETVETAEAFHYIKVYEQDRGKKYLAEYHGMSPKFAWAVKPGAAPMMMAEVGAGKIEGDDVEKLMAACRAKIEKENGAIIERW